MKNLYYRIFFITSAIITILCLAGTITYYAITAHSGNFTTYSMSLFGLFCIICLGLEILTLAAFNMNHRDISRARLFGRYFNTKMYIQSEGEFIEQVGKRHRFSFSKGTVIAFSIQDYLTQIVTSYGTELSKELLTYIVTKLKKNFSNDNITQIGFDYNETFLLFSANHESKTFITKFENFIKETKQEIITKFSMYNCNFLIGAIEFKGRDIPSEEIIRRANLAMIYDKDSRGNDEIVYFDNEMIDNQEYGLTLANEIDEAIKEEQFEVYYQPKFDLKLNRYVGAEALLRWNHPKRGLISPSVFIPICEQSGKILNIDYYVFEHVCRDIQKWYKTGVPLLVISVNLSKRSMFDSQLISKMHSIINTYQVNPLLLEIEVTESVAAKDKLLITSVIKAIQQDKIKVSLDDFGTGYSSLSTLKEMPFDIIKLDKTFIDDIEISEKSREVVTAFIRMAEALNLYVIIEGVQTVKQVNILKKMGADCIQGFYYSKPLPIYAYEAFIKTNKGGKE